MPRRFAIAGSTVFWIAGITAVGAAIRFSTLGLQSYHHDEVITVARVLPGSFGHMLHEVRQSESTPPLYYILAWLWAKPFGLAEIGVRSLSALLGVATIPVTFLIGKELAGRRAGLLVMALVAVNPMLIWYSQEARAYALLVLLCAASLLFFVRFLRTRSYRDLVLWSALSELALASHYFAVFPLAVEAGWLLARHRPRRPVWAAIGGVAAVGALLAPLVLHQANPHHIGWISEGSLGGRIGDSGVSALIGETGNVIGAPAPRTGYAIAPAILVALIALLLVRGSLRERHAAATAAIIGLGAMTLALAGALIGEDYVLARNLLPILVPLLAVIGVAAASSGARRVGLLLTAALCTYWLVFDVVVDLTPRLQRPDWRGVANTLGPSTAPHAVVTWALGVDPLSYYLRNGTEGVATGPVTVPEIDVVSKQGAALRRDQLASRFPHRTTTRLGRFTVLRYSALRPHTVGLRLLHDLHLGFTHNGVMVNPVNSSTIGWTSLPLAPGIGHDLRCRGWSAWPCPAHRALHRAES